MGVTVAILGLGLMGGSLGLALSGWQEGERVKGYDPHLPTAQRALQRKAVGEVTPSAQEAVEGSDIVFLAAPVSVVPGLIAEIASHLADHSIVLDLSSSREWIFSRISHLKGRLRLAGFHPMCGSARGGIDEARANLFAGAPILATPLSEDDGLKNTMRKVGGVLGGKVFFYPLLNMTGYAPW